jgi:uncharacterized protein YhdP
LSTGLATLTDFLFKGPLLKPEAQLRELPVTIAAGQVKAKMDVLIPLADVTKTTVVGTARLDEGKILLPESMPVENLRADLSFTEESVHSDNIVADFLGFEANGKLLTIGKGQPPELRLNMSGQADVSLLQPWLGEHILSRANGVTDWHGDLEIDSLQTSINIRSDLEGVEVRMPEPIGKSARQTKALEVNLQLSDKVAQTLALTLDGKPVAKFLGDLNKGNTFFDQSIIGVGALPEVDEGINFYLHDDQINLDEWFDLVLDLARLETKGAENTQFLDLMKSIKITADDPIFMSRQFGALDFSALSVDGHLWIGTINGDHVHGTFKAEPRVDAGQYRLNLSRLHLVAEQKDLSLNPVDESLSPTEYPLVELNVNSFRLAGRELGQLYVLGQTVGDVWKLSKFKMTQDGVTTTGNGQWVNSTDSGSITSFDYSAVIDEAGGALEDMDMEGFVSRGKGTLSGTFSWIGAPHEFDYSRLNGDFDLDIKDGELVKIEPGSGKLLGLLNFNAIVRRMFLDFSDIFAKGLEFDRIRYAGVLADGEAIMKDAYILSPSVFINMEGKLNLDKETIDMEMHLSPELGGNVALLSTVASPAAGALVFLTQKIFQDQMRLSSFRSYRALGTWKDFELVEIDKNEDQEDASQDSIKP